MVLILAQSPLSKILIQCRRSSHNDICTLCGLTFGGNHGYIFGRSYPCGVPPHITASPRPWIGRLWKIPPCWEHKRLQSPVLWHLIWKSGCHRFFTTKLLCRLSMVQCVILRQHLRTILFIVLVPAAIASACNRPGKRHLRYMTTFHLPRPAQSDPSAPFRYRRFPPLHLTSMGKRHPQRMPWFIYEPSWFIEDPPDSEQEDHKVETPATNNRRESHFRVQTRPRDTCSQ